MSALAVEFVVFWNHGQVRSQYIVIGNFKLFRHLNSEIS